MGPMTADDDYGLRSEHSPIGRWTVPIICLVLRRRGKIRERIERPDMQKSKKRCCVLCGAYAKTRTTARQTEPTVFRPRSTVSATEASQSVWTRPCCDTHSRVSREFRSSSRFLPNGKHNQRPNACVRYSRVLRKDFLYGSPSERDPIL